MRFVLILGLLSLSLTGYGCKAKTAPAKNTTEETTVQEESNRRNTDLSTLSLDEAIKAKYSKLTLDCTYKTRAFKEGADGVVATQTRPGNISWDILKEPITSKTMTISEGNLNLSFKATIDLGLSLDSQFNAIVEVTPRVSINTLDDKGNVITSNESTRPPFDLYETQSLTIADSVFGPSNSQFRNLVKMNCTLNSEVRPTM